MNAHAKAARFGSLVVALAMAATILPIVPAATAYAETRAIFGISSSLGSVDSTTRDRAMTMLADAGCTWTRVGAYWPWTDRNGKANRDWSVSDAFLAAAKSRNQTVVGAIAGYAAWANGGAGDWAPASDPTEFANFARDAVNRYKADIHIWEVWNEENGPDFWKPSPNAAAYAKMLRATYLAIKAADPTAKVVFGGIDRNDYGYLNRVYTALKAYPDAAANNNFFDVLAVHPYADNRPPESDDPAFIWNDMDRNFAGLPKMKAAMEAQGDTEKHIIVTEFGWTVTDVSWTRGVGEAGQADYLKRAYQMAQNWPWVDAMMWYGFKNWSDDELPFSMVNSDLSPRQSYNGYKAAAAGGVTVTQTGGTTTGGTTGGTTDGTTTGPTTGGTTTGGTTTGGTTGGTTTGATTTTRTRLRPKKRAVRAGATATLVGAVSPNQTGSKVSLQVLTGSGWKTVARTQLHAGSRVVVRYRTRRGTYRFRMVFAGSRSGAPSASSSTKVVAG